MPTFEEQILDILKCPVCYLVPRAVPVATCVVGHAVCEDCRPRLVHCPTCRGPFVVASNTILNKICEIVPHYCKYRTFGCNTKLTSDEIKHHETECPERTVKCCFRGDIRYKLWQFAT